jgi:superfamily II RNA helicase
MPKICTKEYVKNNHLFDAWSFTLSDFQKYAIESITQGNNTIITAHTGSGKTLPAEFLLRYCKDMNKKLVYTTPIKALSNEKFYDFQKKYPEISFGIITGDIKFNPDADVLIMTTECLCNTLYQMKMLKEKTLKKEQVNLLFEIDIENELGAVVFDEIHYINDPDRGHVWEECIMMLPNNVQILGLSATMNNPEKFCSWIEKIKGKPVWLCPNEKRVVPLKHNYFITVAKSIYEKFPLEIKNLIETNNFYEKSVLIKDKVFNEIKYEKICKLIKYFRKNNVWVDKKFVLNRMVYHLKIKDQLPAICFVFSQKKCEEYANTISIQLFDEESKVPSTIEDECKKIMMKLPNYKEYINLPEYLKITRLLKKGIAYHHAGVTNVFREMIELLFSKGYIKLLFATETFSVGINMPTRTVVFTSMKKYSNKGFRFLKSHEYTQMAGRAGRRGIDTIGYIYHLTNFYAIQDSFPCSQTMREIFSGKPPAIESKFKINTNIILKLISVGKNDFEDFVKNSMVSDSIDKQKQIYVNILETLTNKKNSMFISIENMKTNIDSIEKYESLENLYNNVNKKKRIKIQREMKQIKDESKTFINDYELYINYKNLENNIIKENKKFKNIDNYIINEITKLLEILRNNEFIKIIRETDCEMITMYNSIENHKINYALTEKGQIAANINELHPLVMAELLVNKNFNNLTSREIASVLSIFINMKLSDENSVHNKNHLYIPKKAINCIEIIENQHKKYYDLQLENDLEDIQSEYLENIQYNMCDFIYTWWNCEDANQCYKKIEKMKSYGVSLGKLIKGILKLNNIIEELEKACIIQNNLELLEKIIEIPKHTLKFIATTQSLYL